MIRLVPIVLGLAGILAMALLGAWNGAFMPWHYGMGGLGALSVLGGLAWIQDARWRDIAGAAAYAFFFSLCCIFLYLIAANRLWRIDLTADRVHSLSPQTESILRSLPAGETFTFQIFAPAREHQQLSRFLATFRREAPSQFRFELFDPARDVDVVQELGGKVEVGKMIAVRSNAQGDPVRRTDAKLEAGNVLRENIVANALARLTQEEQQALYFVTNHGEKTLAQGPNSYAKIANLVATTSIPVGELRLSAGTIPDDAAALVFAGPANDLSPFERELLEEYFADGGKALILLDPIVRRDSALLNFEQLLAGYGIDAPNDFIVDAAAVNDTSSPLTPLVGFTDHPIALATNRTPFLMIQARPLDSTTTPPADVKLEAILGTGNQAWTERSQELRSVKRAIPPDDGKLGPRITAVAASKSTPRGKWGDSMRIVAVGDSDAFLDEHLDRNGDAALFFLQSLNWLREQKQLLSIPPRMLKSTPILLDARRAWTIFALHALLGLALCVGGTAWTLARRRSR